MDINPTEVTAIRTPLSTEESSRVRIVCLSGPIKIIVPLSPREDMEIVRDERDLRSCVLAPLTNPIDNNNTTVQLDRPIHIHTSTGTVGDNHTDPAFDTHTTVAPALTMEKDISVVKQPDCNHPDETQSPLYALSVFITIKIRLTMSAAALTSLAKRLYSKPLKMVFESKP